ncbi:hypothetical protein MPER_04942 [Moniliophthora perniciosa FA553]|nr:hypothetical protein MPER_04942 [Moniliophthora perniciosa FA553]
MPKYEGQLYAYFLFSQGHGYPLWVPEPNTQLPAAYADEGIRIGDVGIITRNGGFDFLFNICLPVDHPVNQHYGTPPGFTPLICDRHTFPVPNYFTKGSAVYGGGATARHLSVSAEATPIPLKFEVACRLVLV